jgi:hypothetical protein
VLHIDVRPLTTSLAIPDDILIATTLENDEVCLGVLARTAEDKLVDESVEQLTEARGIVSAVDDISIILLIEGGLCSELTAEEFGGVGGRAR